MIEEEDFLGSPNYVNTDKYTDAYYKKHPEERTPYRYNTICKKIAVGLIKKYPLRYIIMSTNRLLNLWFNIGYGYRPSGLAWIVCLGQVIIGLLFGFAYLVFRGDWVRHSLVTWTMIAYFSLVHALTVAVYRYIAPIMPLVMMIACFALLRIINISQNKLRSRRIGVCL